VKAREPRMKGATIRELFEWYEARHGVERVRRVVANVPADLRPLVDPDEPHVTLLASSWYPARLVHTLLDAIAADHAPSELERLTRETARAFAGNKLKGVHRFVLSKIVTPEMYAAGIQRMWRILHDTGDRKIELTGQGTAMSYVRNWPGHHRVLCLLTVDTMCAMFETMGCKNVQHERISCVSDGGTECVTRVSWTK
jgi:hypothetical protein